MFKRFKLNLTFAFIASSLDEMQKQLMQNVVKAMAVSKKQQQEKEQKAKKSKPVSLQKDQKPLFSEEKRTKLVTKLGK
jgi:hypothetical protein